MIRQVSIGDIYREVLRIESVLEVYGGVDSAIERCRELSDLLEDIENGKYELVVKR